MNSYVEEGRGKKTTYHSFNNGYALRKLSLFSGKLCGNFITEVPKGEMKNE